MRRVTWVAILLVFFCLQPARAFVHNQISFTWGFHWNLTNLPVTVSANIVNRTTRAVRYFMASDAYSTTNTQAELNALRAAFAQWQSITNSILQFEEGGLVAPRGTINTADNTNVLFWAKTNLTVGTGANISGAFGVTFTTAILTSPNIATFKEADIVLNGIDYSWYTDFSTPDSTNAFVEGTALHEIGHFIGLDHSPLGAATMFAYSGRGVTAQAGLSVDEISAAQFIYPKSNVTAQKGTLKGQVTRAGTGILGAVITLEDTNGTMIAGTVTRSNGVYVLPMIPPGNYRARVSPLDPTTSMDALAIGYDISDTYSNAVTTFLPTTNTAVSLTAGVTNTMNLSVATNEPAFRISEILYTKPGVNLYFWAPLSTTVTQGQHNVTLGVGAPNLPTNNTALTITGDGLSVISAGSIDFNGINFLTLLMNVSSNATPGLRSFLVQQGTNQAYANGFLEVVPTRPDYNFDGLDDYFQRKYFPLFTSTNAAPTADPDHDGYNNSAEYLAGTNPTNAASLLKIEQVKQTAAGTTITWQSGAGKHYQVLSRPLAGTGAFQPVGSPVTGTGATTQFLDVTGTNGIKFYRVQAIP
jgi:Matrixin